LRRRVVIDTNVLVSALLSPNGTSAVILGMIAEGSIDSIYCNAIMNEYSKVLSRPIFGFTRETIDEALDIFILRGIIVIPEKSLIRFRDENDRVFYDSAITGDAELITFNTKHFPKNNL